MNFEGVIESIKSRICLMVGRCSVVATKFADKELSADIELTAREKRRGVEYMQQFGFSSRPKGDVEGLALFIGGSRDNGVVVATRGDFPDLKEGEVMMHSPYGQKILLKNDGSIVVTASNGKSILFEGDLNVKGSVLATQDVAAKCTDTGVVFVDVGATHLSTHNHNSAVGPTSPPIPGT